MSRTDIYDIFCLILGEDVAFSVKIEKSRTVHDLKNLIKKVNPDTLAGIEAKFLDLYHVDIPDAHKEALMASAKAWPLDSPLPTTTRLTKIFPDTPKDDTVHILVKPSRRRPASRELDHEAKRRMEVDGLPYVAPSSPTEERADVSQSRYSPPVAQIDSSTARRSSTVDALYQRLARYHFVIVRGTPASGKSILAQLLEKHIRAREPTTNPIMINAWAPDGTKWPKKLTLNYKPDGPNTIIIDEAQLTYWDNGFWNAFLKPINPESPNRVILFVSYGSPTARVSVVGTSMFVPACNQISLRPVDHQDKIPPAGLLLPADEFFEMVKTVFPTGSFTTDFLDYVLRLTAGHAGAVTDLLRVVVANTSYRQLKHEAREYSLDIFQSQFPIADLWARLDSSGVFRRGLPLLSQLQELPIARVFREVLSNNHVTKEMLGLKEDQDALERCFSEGWLHATVDQTKTLYIFTTPLHQWFVEYYLGTKVSDPTCITDQDVRTFAMEVMRLFSHQQLSSPRKIGTSNVQRPPEAQFQDEFYRCCHEYSKGSVISFPEYGGASGRIDFYIPFKKWGVGLLRDGDRLKNHSSRFRGSGAYAKMEFEDYIILDFRTARPQKGHPEMLKLYYVVFENGFKSIEIQDGSSLRTVEKFELLDRN